MSIKINLKSNKDYVNDLNELLRAFAPEVELSTDEDAVIINFEFYDKNYCEAAERGVIETVMVVAGKVVDRTYIDTAGSALADKSSEKKQAKIMLYRYLSTMTGVRLPYGSLTGIRPTKLYRNLSELGLDAYKVFTDEYCVSEENADFIRRICDNQNRVYSKNPKEIDLFVNIPICTTRCSYCSFISAEYGKIKKSIAPYVAQLMREIADALDIITINGYTLRAVYVGGGTPTSLGDEEFAEVMSALRDINCMEFTVESGRPDTMSDCKLQAMADAGVTRISINPQSFNDKTLEIIGRAHKADDIIERYNNARKYGFIINMDLISALPQETFSDFAYSVDKTIALKPDNITVHTLAIKKGSALKIGEYDNKQVETAVEMLRYARLRLTDEGYKPYYMYRQKYMSGNLDNTGYCLNGTECAYNVDIMEETHSIIACGAGGISKRVYHGENRIERLANPKGIDVYLDRENRIIEDKRAFFEQNTD